MGANFSVPPMQTPTPTPTPATPHPPPHHPAHLFGVEAGVCERGVVTPVARVGVVVQRQAVVVLCVGGGGGGGGGARGGVYIHDQLRRSPAQWCTVQQARRSSGGKVVACAIPSE